MLKRWLVPFTFILLLTGCGQRAEIIATPTPTPTLAPPTATPAPISQPGCTVISPMPTPGPTQRSLFPPVSDSDWVHGPETADVTIIEYSDFQ